VRRLFVPNKLKDTSLILADIGAMSEPEFETHVVIALGEAYPNHHCVLFGGRFEYEGRFHCPDLALVAADFSHWFVIEVELFHHSFDGHVFPQVSAFRYGTPQQDCQVSLAKGLGIDLSRAATLIAKVPRSVAVIVNAHHQRWRYALEAHSIQYVVMTVYGSNGSGYGIEMDGDLRATIESLGFGVYSATDSLIRLPRVAALADGPLQIVGPEGALGEWKVQRDDINAWVIKVKGVADIPDQARIQLVKADGRVSIRLTN
jgi:hypothetical protein